MAWLLLLIQDTVTTREADIRATISGRLDLDYVFRDRAVQAARAALNGGGPADSEGLLFGLARVRLGFEIGDADVVIEVGNHAFDGGADLPLGTDPESTAVFFEQAYLELHGVLVPELHLKVGVQDFGFRLRPDGEAFFLDASRSESFYSGATTFLRNTADRDVLGPAGFTLRWEPADFIGLELWWATMIEGGRASDDENLAALFVNGILSERVSYFLFAGLVAGAGRDRQVWTTGLGVDIYLTRERTVEIFAEIYGQFGLFDEEAHKSAAAAHVGLRVYGTKVWGEAAFSFRSGDDDPFDERDNGFQSYENVNRFAILESARFGLDLDTNLMSLAFALGWRQSETLEIRLDAGWFRFHEEVRTATAAELSDERNLGVELDLSVAWVFSPQARFRLRFAALLGSDFLDDVTRDSGTWMFFPGFDVNF
jgi:hypothetical protein